jgi:hypothetical protein
MKKLFFTLVLFAALFSKIISATYYVSTTGNDSNPGTLALPWKTLHKALTTIGNNDTVIVLEGYYNETKYNYVKKSNIVIKGQGNVVIDGYFPEFKNPQKTEPWVSWDESKGIYRSKYSYITHLNPDYRDQVKGTFIFGNEEHRFVVRRKIRDSLHCYRYTDLATDNQFWDTDTAASLYVGPGLYHDTEGYIDPAEPGKIYVRLKPSRYMTQQDSAYSLYSLNPNDFSMNIGYNYGSWIQLDSCRNVRFENLRLYGYYFHIMNDCNYLYFKDLKIHGGHIEFSWGNSIPTHDVVIDNVHFTHGYFPWVTWQDIKTGRMIANSYEYAPLVIQGKTYNVEIKNCRFEKYFFGILITHNTNTIHDISIHNNIFEKILDDCIFLASSCYNIDIYNNIMLGPGTGVSRYGQKNSGHPGTVYIHHNVIDCSTPFLWGRTKSDGTYVPGFEGYNNTGKRCHWAFGYHRGVGFGSEGDPRKIYNNTCLVGIGSEISMGLYGVYPRNLAIKHSVFNNIFIQTDSTNLIDKNSLEIDGSMLINGNMYYRAGGISNLYPILARYIGPYYPYYQNYYDFQTYQSLTGFETNGIFEDPLLDTNYCPNSAYAFGGVALPSTWPMVNNTNLYRGALYPCLPTSVSVSVITGWNMISNPVTTTTDSLRRLFPTSLFPYAFVYDSSGSYVQSHRLLNGIGYWAFFPSPETIILKGTQRMIDTISVRPGWNMIGSISKPIATAQISSIPSGMITSQFFSFNVGSYVRSDTVYPGRGYWVKLNSSGMLVLGSDANPINIVSISEQPPDPPDVVGNLYDEPLPLVFALHHNYPNPFNPSTTIRFSIAHRAQVTLKIFDLLGRELETLVNDELNPGEYSMVFAATSIASGVYFYQLRAGTFIQTNKMLIIK